MLNRELLHVFNESIRIAKTRFTAWSDEATVTVATDPTVPSVPTLAAAAADQSIDLTITAPTTNTDGTTIVDLKDYTIYYSTSSGIDITNPGTYSGTFNTSSTQHTFPTSAQHYFKAICNDKWSNSSAGSSEVNATPTSDTGSVSVDDYTNNIANVFVGKGMIGIEFQPPKSSWARWAGFKLYTADDGGLGAGSLPADPTTLIYTGSGGCFLHKGLNESYLYEYKLVVLGEDGTTTSGTISDNSGAGYQPNAADNSALLAETIMAERIFATTELYAQDAVIGASGSLRSGQTAYNTGTGWWVGDVSGTPKFSLGNPAGKWLTMDGTNFAWSFGNCSMDTSGNLTATSATLSGAITATSGTIAGFTVNATEGLYAGAAATRVQMKPGAGFWAGATAQASAPFRVSAAGVLVATSATITGGITASSGTIGGFTIGASALTSGSGATAVGIAPATYPFYAGNTTAASAPFRVSNTGALVATSATITGDITCSGTSTWTGSSISTTYTAAKCTDAAADQTSANVAASISGQGALATLSAVGASNCDTTIISGGKIITGLLTASNIQAGTLDASVVNIVNLTVTGVITCQAGSSYAGNAISTTYTSAKCTDAAADQTSANVAASISGQGALATLSAVGASNCNTTIISGGKIITGLLTASNITTGTMSAARISGGTIGACTISANNITTGSMSAARITAGTMSATRISGGTIGACTISANNITTGGMNAARITAGTMSVGRILIDGNINFKPSSTYYKIINLNRIEYSTSYFLSVSEGIFAGGTSNVLNLADPEGMAFRCSLWPGILKIADFAETGGAQGTAAGRIKIITSTGYTRYLRMYT